MALKRPVPDEGMGLCVLEEGNGVLLPGERPFVPVAGEKPVPRRKSMTGKSVKI